MKGRGLGVDFLEGLGKMLYLGLVLLKFGERVKNLVYILLFLLTDIIVIIINFINKNDKGIWSLLLLAILNKAFKIK